MKNLHQVYQIKASVNKVWQALVDPKQINLWGGGPAKMNDKLGTRFELWDGDIYGRNVEVIPHRKLVQEWYAGNWPQPSRVTFTLIPENEETHLELLHEDIPDEEYDEIIDGWKNYYIGKIKAYLEKEV